jgi:hypothetical protein
MLEVSLPVAGVTVAVPMSAADADGASRPTVSKATRPARPAAVTRESLCFHTVVLSFFEGESEGDAVVIRW